MINLFKTASIVYYLDYKYDSLGRKSISVPAKINTLVKVYKYADFAIAAYWEVGSK